MSRAPVTGSGLGAGSTAGPQPEDGVSASGQSRHPDGAAVVVEHESLDVLVRYETALDPGTGILGRRGEEAGDSLR